MRKLRLTGGEPLVRRDVERLVALLAPLGAELTLTTNASLLAAKADALAAAGLDRVTVSLDSLDDETFRAMNDVDFPVQRVLDGIDAAAAAGLPVKVNAVVKRGAERARDPRPGALLPRDAATRSASSSTWTSARRTAGGSTTSSRRRRSSSGSRPSSRSSRSSRATAARSRKRWRYRDGAGEIGLIASVTQPFCGDCTRARISAEGRLYTCLFAVRGHDLRALVRGGARDEELRDSIAASGACAPTATRSGAPTRRATCPRSRCSYIGG